MLYKIARWMSVDSSNAFSLLSRVIRCSLLDSSHVSHVSLVTCLFDSVVVCAFFLCSCCLPSVSVLVCLRRAPVVYI